jgi:Contractile injection system tube protein
MVGFPPISPRLQRGSIIAIDQSTQQQTTIEFQYNPDTLTRKVTAQTVQESTPERGEPLRLKGPPQETISLDIEIDATDLLAQADSIALQSGIYPALAALEVLLYPSYENVDKNEKLARDGVMEIIPFEAPLTLFVWGKKRTLPVRLTSYTITEESFDPELNPIRAKVSLELQVLTYYDLGFNTRGGEAFITHHKNIEQLAKQYHSENK